jgi:hypothetical protein
MPQQATLVMECSLKLANVFLSVLILLEGNGIATGSCIKPSVEDLIDFSSPYLCLRQPPNAERGP